MFMWRPRVSEYREGLPGWHPRNHLGPNLQPSCGDYGTTGSSTGQRTEDGKMKLHPRTMTVKRAEVELSQFLLQWAERHELTWCEMARAFTEQIQMCLKYMLRESTIRKIQTRKPTKIRLAAQSAWAWPSCKGDAKRGKTVWARRGISARFGGMVPVLPVECAYKAIWPSATASGLPDFIYHNYSR